MNSDIYKKHDERGGLQEFVILFVVLIIACVFEYVFIVPLYKEMKTEEIKVEIKKRSMNSRELLVEKIKKIDETKEGEDYAKTMNKIEKLISTHDDYENYLAHIIKFAGEKNLVIEKLSIDEQEKNIKNDGKNANNTDNSINLILSDTDLKNKKIEIVIIGDALSFTSFLEVIERSIPFVQIKSISIEGGDESEKIGGNKEGNNVINSMLSFKMSFNFFYY